MPRNSVFRTVAMMRWVVVLACSCEDCAAAIPIVLAPTTATPIATATMTELMLRGMIASTYRTIIALYRRFDLRRCDLHHRLANFSWRLVSCDLDRVPVAPHMPHRAARATPEASPRPSTSPSARPRRAEDDQAAGTVYVLRSKSEHPVIAANRDLVHKIGVTNMSVDQRIAGARLQPTFLMADVEVVATYELYNISRMKLENLIHRVFDPARLDIEIKDRFGQPVVPHEWFLVPLFVIDEAVKKIRDGTISNLRYDPKSASLVEAAEKNDKG